MEAQLKKNVLARIEKLMDKMILESAKKRLTPKAPEPEKKEEPKEKISPEMIEKLKKFYAQQESDKKSKE